jgi:hypothetical protein
MCKTEEASHSLSNESPKHVLKAGNLYCDFFYLDDLLTANFCRFCIIKDHFQLMIEQFMFYKLFPFCLHVT